MVGTYSPAHSLTYHLYTLHKCTSHYTLPWISNSTASEKERERKCVVSFRAIRTFLSWVPNTRSYISPCNFWHYLFEVGMTFGERIVRRDGTIAINSGGTRETLSSEPPLNAPTRYEQQIQQLVGLRNISEFYSISESFFTLLICRNSDVRQHAVIIFFTKACFEDIFDESFHFFKAI